VVELLVVDRDLERFEKRLVLLGKGRVFFFRRARSLTTVVFRLSSKAYGGLEHEEDVAAFLLDFTDDLGDPVRLGKRLVDRMTKPDH